jgi:hypothetical protein
MVLGFQFVGKNTPSEYSTFMMELKLLIQGNLWTEMLSFFLLWQNQCLDIHKCACEV